MSFCGGTGGSGGLPEWCDGRGRNAWDLMAVVLAVRGRGEFYKFFPGVNVVDRLSGRNTWTDDPFEWQPARDDSGHFQAWMPDSGSFSEEGERVSQGVEYNATANEIDKLLLRAPTGTARPTIPCHTWCVNWACDGSDWCTVPNARPAPCLGCK
eukprot:3208259-Prymnesium_polylepis.1